MAARSRYPHGDESAPALLEASDRWRPELYFSEPRVLYFNRNGTPLITEETWEQYREIIIDLFLHKDIFINGDMTCERAYQELRAEMIDRYNFYAIVSQYQYRLKTWGVTKDKLEWKAIGLAHMDQARCATGKRTKYWLRNLAVPSRMINSCKEKIRSMGLERTPSMSAMTAAVSGLAWRTVSGSQSNCLLAHYPPTHGYTTQRLDECKRKLVSQVNRIKEFLKGANKPNPNVSAQRTAVYAIDDDPQRIHSPISIMSVDSMRSSRIDTCRASRVICDQYAHHFTTATAGGLPYEMQASLSSLTELPQLGETLLETPDSPIDLELPSSQHQTSDSEPRGTPPPSEFYDHPQFNEDNMIEDFDEVCCRSAGSLFQ